MEGRRMRNVMRSTANDGSGVIFVMEVFFEPDWVWTNRGVLQMKSLLTSWALHKLGLRISKKIKKFLLRMFRLGLSRLIEARQSREEGSTFS